MKVAIKEKALIYSSYKSVVQQMAGFFERSVYDVFAARSLSQFDEIVGFRAPEIIILVLSQDLLLYSDTELHQIADASKHLIIFNLTNLRSEEISVIFQKRTYQFFDAEGVLFLNEHIKQNGRRVKDAANKQVRQALLVEQNDETGTEVVDLLSRHHFHIRLVHGIEEAQQLLREQKYDLVVANSTLSNDFGVRLVNHGKRGFNKNTAFILRSNAQAAIKPQQLNAPDAWFELCDPLDLHLLDEKVRSLPAF